MIKIFWTVVALETAVMAVLFKGTLNMETQSGGRDITQFIYVGMPGIILLFAIALFTFTSSSIPRSIALTIVLTPPALLAWNLSRHNVIVRALTPHIASGWSSSSFAQGLKTAFILGPPSLLGHTPAEKLLNDVQLEALSLEHFRDPGQRNLGRAIVTRNIPLVKRLASNAKLNEADDQDLKTLLDFALRQRGQETTEIVEALLSAGADPNLIPGKSHATPLSRATLDRNYKAFLELLHHGADPNSRTSFGDVSFHSAFDVYLPDRAAYLIQLLDHGADVNAVDSESKTALMLAAINNDAESVDLLLDRGADAARTDSSGRTALDYLEQVISRDMQSSQDVSAGRRAAQRLRTGK